MIVLLIVLCLGGYTEKLGVVFLPMIDMPPHDYSCDLPTIELVCRQASQYNQTLVQRFDQPLNWKA